MSKPLPPADLEHILRQTADLWDEVRGQSVFLTGGTGFFGHWLVESFLAANHRLQLGARLTLLTRDPEAFRRKSPHLARDPAITLWEGDVRNFVFPPGSFSLVVHAATPAEARLEKEQPEVMKDIIVAGTQRTLDFAATAETRKFLFISSGAVYGASPPHLFRFPEEYASSPHFPPATTAYGFGKHTAETLCQTHDVRSTCAIKIARCFAFVGPHLPLEAHFAIGNFMNDALHHRPIQISDGTPLRSYLYAADLAIWLWTILLRGEAQRPYNVGSEEAISIRQLAGLVQAVSQEQEAPVVTEDLTLSHSRYLPSTQRAQTELALEAWIPLALALKRTLQWHKRVP